MGSDRSSALRLRTPLRDLLGIRCPLVQAPMAGGWTPCGERTWDLIRAVRARTDQPFGVNFLLAPPQPGGGDVAAVQRFLDGIREELGLPSGGTEIALPPSPL